jgi:NAD(P)-dependent dehydrogenase (short-subunit alcohol dehydrogenase family)
MDASLENQIAVVTGGTRGIGYAIAERLLEAGASVAICGRSAESLEKAISQLARKSMRRIVGGMADVSKQEDVIKFFQLVDQEIGPPSILINNAGVGKFASTADLTIEDWRTTLETNLFGAFYCSHEVLTRFRKRGGGYIINISSLAGVSAFVGGAAYNASKFGLNGFTEAMMLDHRFENVKVSNILPGSVDTDFSPGSAHADWKIAPCDIAEIVLMLLRMPARTLVSRVDVRPSRPKK